MESKNFLSCENVPLIPVLLISGLKIKFLVTNTNFWSQIQMSWFPLGALTIIHCHTRPNLYRNLIHNNYFKFLNYLICIKATLYDGYKLSI